MNKMGISSDDLEAVQEQMDSIMENMNDPTDMNELAETLGVSEMMEQFAPSDDADPDSDFTPGGAPSFPNFFNMFSGNQTKNSSEKQDKKQKKDKKHLMY